MTADQQQAYTAWCTLRFQAAHYRLMAAAAKQQHRAMLWEERFLHEYEAAQEAAAQRAEAGGPHRQPRK